MKELIDKISSYNLFNYLFPGVIYVVLLREIGTYDMYQENNLIGLFLYYFIGLVISRFGSLLVEPLVQKSTFVKFADYKDYVIASQNDKKIELFSEINNMYRTIISLMVVVLLSKAYEKIEEKLEISNETSFIILTIALLIIFVFSYRKQTNYVVKRVNAQTKNMNI